MAADASPPKRRHNEKGLRRRRRAISATKTSSSCSHWRARRISVPSMYRGCWVAIATAAIFGTGDRRVYKRAGRMGSEVTGRKEIGTCEPELEIFTCQTEVGIFDATLGHMRADSNFNVEKPSMFTFFLRQH